MLWPDWKSISCDFVFCFFFFFARLEHFENTWDAQLGIHSVRCHKFGMKKKTSSLHLFFLCFIFFFIFIFRKKRVFFSKNPSQNPRSRFERKRRWSSVCRSRATPPWRRCPRPSYGAPWDASSQAVLGWGWCKGVRVKYVQCGVWGVREVHTKNGGKNGCGNSNFFMLQKILMFFFLETDPENFWAKIDLSFCWLRLWRHSSRFLCLHSKLLFPGLT